MKARHAIARVSSDLEVIKMGYEHMGFVKSLIPWRRQEMAKTSTL